MFNFIYAIFPIKKIKHWYSDKIFRQLINNSGLLLSGTTIATFLGLLSTIIKTRTLGPELFGLLTVVVTYVEIVNSLVTFSPWQALIKYGAESIKNNKPQEFMGYVKLSFLLDLFSAIIGIILAISFAVFFGSLFGWAQAINKFIVVYSLVILFNFSSFPIGVLRLLNGFKYLMIQQVLSASLGLIGAAVVFIIKGSVLEFLYVMVISKIIGTTYLISITIYTLKKNKYLNYWNSPVLNGKKFLKFSGWTYMSSTLDIPVQQLDIMIVSAVISLEAAGIYKIIKQVTQLLGKLADPIYQAIYPQFAEMIAGKDRIGASKYAVKIGAVILAVVSPIVLIMALFSPWWLGALFGSEFSLGWIALCAFLLFKTISVSCIAIHPLFTAMGYVKQTSIILLLVNGLYLLFAWFLGKKLGLLGLSLAYGFQFSIVVGAKIFYILRQGFKQVPDLS